MADPEFGPSASDPLPDRLKQYLSDTARRELDTLRAQLEVKLIALEKALARPSEHDSIEYLVIDLARVATAEAEAAAARASLDARLQAEERSGIAEANRTAEQARVELDMLREVMQSDLAREREQSAAALAEARRELDDLQRAKEQAETRAAEVEKNRAAAVAAQTAGAARLKAAEAEREEADRARQTAEARARDATLRLEHAEVRAAAAADRTRDAQARAEEADARARQAEESARELAARIDEIEQRVRQAEERAGQVEARARQTEEQAQKADERARQAEDHAQKADERARTAESRIAEVDAERQCAVADLDAARQALDRERAARQQEAGSRAAEIAARLGDAERRSQLAEERVRALELQLFHRDHPAHGAEEDLGHVFAGPSAPGAKSPTRGASRYRFASTIDVEVDGEAGMLVDLSVMGAQVRSANALHEGRVVGLVLLSDEIPVSCSGRVVWTRLEPKSQGRSMRYLAGLSFTQVDVAAVEAFIIRYSAT
jgi:PilZ domain